MSQSGSGPVDEGAFNQAIAAEIRALLSRRNIGQAQAGAALGFSANAISRRWNAKTPWTTAEMIALCDWLDVDLAQVMADAKRVARGA